MGTMKTIGREKGWVQGRRKHLEEVPLDHDLDG